MSWNDRFSRRGRNVKGSAVRELLKITEQPEFISFGGGLPAPDVFPVGAIAEAAARVLREQPEKALQYSTTEGYRPLRRWIAASLCNDNLYLTEENILITAGSQQALDLLGKLLIDPEDEVVVESPTYLATLQCWSMYGARFVAVASDDDGIVTAQLPSILSPALATNGKSRVAPKMIYTVPNFQNPRGVTMSQTRREALANLASRYDVIVVEDDPYGALRFEGKSLPSLMSLDAAGLRERVPRVGRIPYNGNVIGLGSFSKVLAPGLRVGWIAAAAPVIEKLTLLKQGTDLHTATLNQLVVHDLASSGFLARHLRVIVDNYRARRDTMLTALETHMPQGIRWTRPEGGMFLWITLPAEVNAADVLREALKRKVAFVCGAPFHPRQGDREVGTNTMRLNFSNATHEQIREGIARLAEAMKAVLHLHPAAA